MMRILPAVGSALVAVAAGQSFSDPCNGFQCPGSLRCVRLGNLPTCVPSQPDFPDIPDIPDLPNIPDIPDLPNIPDIPDLPNIPDIPDIPSNPCLTFPCGVFESCVTDSQGIPSCVPFADPCSFFPCVESQECVVGANNIPMCVPVDNRNPCDSFPCGVFESCVTDSQGIPSCVPFADPCYFFTCGELEECVVSTDNVPMCVPVNGNPCDTFPCGEFASCVVNAVGTPSCVPFADPCYFFPCGELEECIVSADNVPVCVPVDGNACDTFPCGEFASCVTDSQGIPSCVPFADPCYFNSCDDTERCIVLPDNFPMCIQLYSDPCNVYPCAEYEACVVTDDGTGTPFCAQVAVDPLGPCANIACGDFENCVVRDGYPQCVSIDDTCTALCGPGERCVLDNTHIPVCIPVTDPCNGWVCQDWEFCETSETGAPVCRTREPNCGYSSCLPHEVCVQYSYCVSDPCIDFPCGEGERCEVGEYGEAICRGVDTTMCGNMVCQPFETCVNEFDYSYCEYRDPCSSWDCPDFTTCVSDGITAYCSPTDGIPCGDSTCDPTFEMCIPMGEGYIHTCVPNGLTSCGECDYEREFCDGVECKRHSMRKMFRGVFGSGRCEALPEGLKTTLAEIIKTSVGDSSATVAFGCPSLSFFVEGDFPVNITAPEVSSRIVSSIYDPTLLFILGYDLRVSEMTEPETITCYVENGQGIYIDGYCYIRTCFYGYEPVDEMSVCVPFSDSKDNHHTRIVIIVLVAVCSVLLIVITIGVCCFYASHRNKKQQVTRAVPIAPVPAVVAEPQIAEVIKEQPEVISQV